MVKRVFLVNILCLFLIINLIGCTSSVETVGSKFETSINKKNYEEASQTYIKYKEKANVINKLDEIVKVKVDGVKSQYMDKSLSLTYATKMLTDISKATENKSYIEEAKSYITKIEDSRKAYDSGLKLFTKGQYAEAIGEFKKVKEEDNNYTDARSKIEEATKSFLTTKLGEAEGLANQNLFSSALKVLDEIGLVIPGEKSVIDKRVEYKQKMMTYSVQRKKELLAQTTSKFDDMRDSTIIVPPGFSTRYINVNYNYSILPRMMVSGGSALLTFELGFNDDDWVFFERITFNADGDIWDRDISFSDRQTQVIGGGNIAEWTVIPVGKYFDEKFKEEAMKLANAKDAKIRFSGEGYRDHTLNEKEKLYIKNFIELLEIYENESSL